jgi:hypothetical protein
MFETVVVVTVVAVVVINNGVVAHQAFEGDDSVNDIFMLVVDVCLLLMDCRHSFSSSCC